MARFNLGGRPVYRTRKEGGIMSSIGGFFIGLLMVVIASPLAAWYAESQHRADDFSAAQVVAPDSSASGYVVVEGTPTQSKPLTCPVKTKTDAAANSNVNEETVAQETNTSCVFTEKKVDKYDYEVKEQCGTLLNNQVQIRYKGEECDDDGTNCEPCYDVEEYDWQNVSTDQKFADFSLGNYKVTPSDSTNFIGEQEFTEYELVDLALVVNANTPGDYNVGDLRNTYTYLPTGDHLLVAGDVETGGAITAAYEKRPYVISSLSYQGTLEDLQSQDNATKWILRIVSLALMVFGMVLIVGPLTLFTNIFRAIPWLGKRVDKGVDAVISLVAALIGVGLWLLVWGIVLVVKNIWIILIILVVIGVGAFILVKRGKQKHAAGANQPPAQQPPASPSSPSQGGPASQPPVQ